MQQIISFFINLIQSFVDTCLDNELLSWIIYLFVIGIIFTVISTLWKR